MQSEKVMGIPSELVQQRSRGKTKFIVGGLVIALAVVYLIYTGVQSTAAYFLTVDELYAQQSAMMGKQVRVSGMVDATTINYDNKTLTLNFEIMGENGQNLPITFNGPMPDQMREGAEAIVEGTFDGNIFTAKTLLLKCPSRYDDTIEEVTVNSY